MAIEAGRKTFLPGLFVVVCTISVYNLLFFNRYFPITEGWFSVYAQYILMGKIPYRDFHLAVPPLYPLGIAAFIHFFGPGFFALRIFGVLLILLMSTSLFTLYSRIFPVYIAALTTILSMVYYQSRGEHIPYDFLQFVSVFALISACLIAKYCAQTAHERAAVPASATYRSAMKLLLPAGILSGAAFFTKQSNGAFVVIACTISVLIGSSRPGVRHSLRSFAVFGAGVLIPISAVMIWLFHEGALPGFFQQVVYGAVESKGTLRPIFLAWLPRLFTLENTLALVFALLGVKVLEYNSFFIERFGLSEKRQFLLTPRRNMFLLGLILLISVFCILITYVDAPLDARMLSAFLSRALYYSTVIVATTSAFIWFCVSFFKFRKGWNEYLDIFIISVFSLGLAYGTATSNAVSESAAFLPLGLTFGYLFLVHSRYNRGRILCGIGFLILMLYMPAAKYVRPYAWWGISEPDIRMATQPSSVPYLKGMYLSKESNAVISETKNIIEKYTIPGDAVFAFPNIPLFYFLTDRYPKSFLVVEWFDVVPDHLAIEEARRLLEFPPKLILDLNPPDFVYENHEQGFRKGQRSGQRQIGEAIRTLTSGRASSYVLEKQFPLKDWTLRVWRKTDGSGRK